MVKGDRVPFFIGNNMELLDVITAYAREATEGTAYFVVDVHAGKVNRNISILIDGDEGISIEKCSEISRQISRRIDEELGEDTAAFTMEVSSPGADRPLKLERQYPKHIGRSLRFVDSEGKTREGVLTGVKNGEIILQETVK